MLSNWFTPTLNTLLSGLEIDDESRTNALQFLAEVAIAAGGKAHASAGLNEEEQRAVAVPACERGLHAFFRTPKPGTMRPSYWLRRGNGDSPFIDIGRRQAKVNLNYATTDELAALPGLGPVTAQRVVTHREHSGEFVSLDQLAEIKGLDADARAQAGATLTLDGEAAVFATENSASNAGLASIPAIANIRDLALTPRESGSRVCTLLARAPGWLRVHRPPRNTRPIELSKRRAQAELRLMQMKKNFSEARLPGGEVATLKGPRYLSFLLDAFAQAQQSIQVLMFFVRYEDDKNYPINAIIDALIAAKARGIEVHVLMDKDREQDIFLSRIINKDAMKKLRDAGIDARFDDPATLTHSKLVIIDDNHVVMGSHNWTAGSMFAYDDVSVYLHSAELGAVQGARFQARFAEATPG